MKVRSDQPRKKNAKPNRHIASFAWAMSAVAIFATARVEAASISYFLDQSNRLPDGTDYLKVTIDDQGAPGAINFTIQDLASLANPAICNLSGILEFGFNGIELSKKNILGLPQGWTIKHDKKMDGFGKFENVLVGKGWSWQDPLTFSIVGIQGDNFSSYVSSHDKSDGFFFGAEVGSSPLHDKNHGCHECSKNVYFAGGVLAGGGDPAPVPIPPAVLLFGSGLLGLGGVARRKKPGGTPLVARWKTGEVLTMEDLS